MRAIHPLKLADITLTEANLVRRTVGLIWEDMAALLGGSLLIALSALPVVVLVLATGNVALLAVGLFTVVPAWVAFAYMAGHAADTRPTLADFLAAFVRYYGQSCLLALPVAVLLVIALTVSTGLTEVTTASVALLVFQLAALLAALSIFMFAAPILSLFQVRVAQAWAYGLVLVLRSPVVALGLLALAFLLVTAATALGLGIWLIVPLIFVPFQVNSTLMLVRKTTELEKSSQLSH